MVFLGTSFFGDNKCGNMSAIEISDINSITLQNGVYDTLFVTTDVWSYITSYDTEWNFDTVLYATFKNNLLAGNLEFSIDNISSVRIKKREKGQFEWVTILEIPINTVEDLDFTRNYAYCKGNTEYEFAIVPMLDNGIEGNINIIECKSEFEGVYLIEPDVMLHMFLNLQMNQQRNQTGSIVQTLGRNKPFYITNGIYNYDSGSINVSFIQMNRYDCQLDVENGAKYRQYIDNILSDHKPKILKTEDGRMWIVAVTEAIQQSDSLTQVPNHTINWTEIADCDNQYDMYINGFNDFYAGG